LTAHKPEHYVGGIWDESIKEWRGRFHATEEELYDHLEKDCSDDEEGLIVIGMIEALKYYQIAWENMSASARREG